MSLKNPISMFLCNFNRMLFKIVSALYLVWKVRVIYSLRDIRYTQEEPHFLYFEILSLERSHVRIPLLDLISGETLTDVFRVRDCSRFTVYDKAN